MNGVEITLLLGEKVPEMTGTFSYRLREEWPLSKLRQFREYREKMNEKILTEGDRITKRFFSLDSAAYQAGALDTKTKELLGLIASAVLRCNDCIAYHIIRAVEEGATDDEIRETLSIALIVGGSIVIPHVRYAYELLEEARQAAEADS